jgi:hypothetical protein
MLLYLGAVISVITHFSILLILRTVPPIQDLHINKIVNSSMKYELIMDARHHKFMILLRLQLPLKIRDITFAGYKF